MASHPEIDDRGFEDFARTERIMSACLILKDRGRKGLRTVAAQTPTSPEGMVMRGIMEKDQRVGVDLIETAALTLEHASVFDQRRVIPEGMADLVELAYSRASGHARLRALEELMDRVEENLQFD